MRNLLILLVLTYSSVVLAQGYQPSKSGSGGGSSPWVACDGGICYGNVLIADAGIVFTPDFSIYFNGLADTHRQLINYSSLLGQMNLLSNGWDFGQNGNMTVDRNLDVGASDQVYAHMTGAATNTFRVVTSTNNAYANYQIETADGGSVNVAGATNALLLFPAKSGSDVLIVADGGDANIGIQILPKGSGKITLAAAGGANGPELCFGGNSDPCDSYIQYSYSINYLKFSALNFELGGAVLADSSVRVGNGKTNYIDLGGGIAAGDPVTLTAGGGGANISFNINTKGDAGVLTGGYFSAPGFFCTDSLHCGTAAFSAATTKTVTVVSGCNPICTNQTSTTVIKCAVSSTTLTATESGSSSDTFSYFCF